jgi:retron-type reverse transcriptase
VATILGRLCTESPRRRVVFDGTTYFVATGPRGLPQGASTSPGLSNQVARRLDRRLAGLAGKLDATYTRYADDLTFSGDSALDARVGYLLARVRHLARAEGFAVNEAKTRVLRQNAAQVVTGLVVNDRPGVARVEVRRLRALLHRAKSEGLDAQNRDNHPDFRAHLRGKIAYISMARPEAGARLLEAFMEVVGEM